MAINNLSSKESKQLNTICTFFNLDEGQAIHDLTLASSNHYDSLEQTIGTTIHFIDDWHGLFQAVPQIKGVIGSDIKLKAVKLAHWERIISGNMTPVSEVFLNLLSSLKVRA
jgi:hypothetical protein